MSTTSVMVQLISVVAALAVPIAIAGKVRKRNQVRDEMPQAMAEHLDRRSNRDSPLFSASHTSEVIFTVRNDVWQYRPLQIFGNVCLISGLSVLAAWALWLNEQPVGIIYVFLAAFLLVAAIPGFTQGNSFARLRVEGTPDRLWVWTGKGEPRQVMPNEILVLKRLFFDNYGGIDVRDQANKRIFMVQRIAPGYEELIAFLRVHRPDLPLPPNA